MSMIGCASEQGCRAMGWGDGAHPRWCAAFARCSGCGSAWVGWVQGAGAGGGGGGGGKGGREDSP